MSSLPRTRRAMSACSLAGLFAMLPTASADEPAPVALWQPGNPTTSELPGEVGTAPVHADTDGVYGRFDGDLSLFGGLGGELESGSGRGLVKLSAHYYWTAGVYATYRAAFGEWQDRLTADRIGSLGVDLRPLFIPRWSLDWQTGPAVLDLLLDSISLAGGAFFADVPSGQSASKRGFEASLGAGLALSGRAPGPWLAFRYAVRWPEAGAASGSAWLLIGWQLMLPTELSSSAGALP